MLARAGARAREVELAAQVIHFDTSVLPPKQQFTAWQHSVVGFEVSRPDAPPEAPFAAVVQGYPLGELAVIETRLDNPLRFRGPLGVAQPRNASIVFLRRGMLSGSLGDLSLVAGEGQIVCFDWQKLADVELQPGLTLVVIVPMARLEAELGELPGLHGAIVEGAGGRLLAEYMHALHQEAATAAASETGLLARATEKMIAACLSGLPAAPRESDTSRRRAVRLRVAQLVEERLGDPRLTPDFVIRELGLSRSTLYRAFAAVGGIAGYIQRRQLEAAHAALGSTGDLRSVKAIAHRYGFSSAPHFTRAFRKQFGHRPVDVRADAADRFDTDDAAGTSPQERLRKLVLRRAATSGPILG
jgi:AraC-like DNA-binding protein